MVNTRNCFSEQIIAHKTNQKMVLGHQSSDKKLHDKKPFKQVRFEKVSYAHFAATGEDSFPHMFMVLGWMENRFDGT